MTPSPSESATVGSLPYLSSQALDTPSPSASSAASMMPSPLVSCHMPVLRIFNSLTAVRPVGSPGIGVPLAYVLPNVAAC